MEVSETKEECRKKDTLRKRKLGNAEEVVEKKEEEKEENCAKSEPERKVVVEVLAIKDQRLKEGWM